MKHIKHINELFGIGHKFRSFFNKDEGAAKEVLNRIKSTLDIEESKSTGRRVRKNIFKFDIDGFDIRSVKSIHGEHSLPWESHLNEEGPHNIGGTAQTSYDTKYELFIDNVKVESSDYINEKIWKKLQSIIDSRSPISDFKRSYNTK